MTDAFPACLAVTLKEEGGYVKDPRDPGGETNLGVTRRVWEEWTHTQAAPGVMKSLTVNAVTPLYRAQYWQATSCDQLPPALAMCVFDFAVNGGVSRSARTLQQCVGSPMDGHIGPATLRELQQVAGAQGLSAVVRIYMNTRRAFYRSLPTFDTFGKGWLARCDRIETAALGMV